MGGKKAGGLCGMGLSRRMGNGEDLPLTVARLPPGWVGRAHNRVGPKKFDPKVGGSGYLCACSSVILMGSCSVSERESCTVAMGTAQKTGSNPRSPRLSL